MKLAPVIEALERRQVATAVLLTGQHDRLLDGALRDLRITPTRNLSLMQPDQSLAMLSARVLTGLRGVFEKSRPEWLLVQGDTTSVAMGALAAFYDNIRVAHVEAGLRTEQPRDPFPEEINRRLVASLADLHFAPTERARQNLLRENVRDECIHVVGNTVIDTLHHARDTLVDSIPEPEVVHLVAGDHKLLLVTAHRRESFGPDLDAICIALRQLAARFAGVVRIVFPVHLNPRVQKQVYSVLSGVPGVDLVEPLSYLPFVRLLLRATVVVTDSGGVTEEAAALGKPTIVVRRTTERREAMEAGVAELVAPDPGRIIAAVVPLLEDPVFYEKRAVATNAFGDGRAADRIVDVLMDRLEKPVPVS